MYAGVLDYPLKNTRFFVSNVEIKIQDTGKIDKLFLKVEKKLFASSYISCRFLNSFIAAISAFYETCVAVKN